MFEKYGFENEKWVAITREWNGSVCIAPCITKEKYEDWWGGYSIEINLDRARQVTLIDGTKQILDFKTYIESSNDHIEAILFQKQENGAYEISFCEKGEFGELEEITEYSLYDKNKKETNERNDCW